jgi:flavin-dependent dehydrogenase
MEGKIFAEDFAGQPDGIPRGLELRDGARVAVVGGGPAGSFFSYFLLDMADRVGLELDVDIYEPRDFSKSGPPGCNMCAGIVSESLVQMLAAEGINLPPTVVQRAIDSYHLHMDVGSVRIETPLHEKRIGTVYRGAGPRDLEESRWTGLDGHLQALASEKGAQVIPARIAEITLDDGRPRVSARNGSPQTYDLLAVAVGVNSAALKLPQDLGIDYGPPRTTKTFLREYLLGADRVEQTLGDAIQVFLLDIPRLEFGMLVPKGDYISVCLLGEKIDSAVVQSFMDAPEVRKYFPADVPIDQFSCQCSPSINVGAASQPFGDRIVFIGDCGVARLYKDGIGSAYRTAKAAATTAIFRGVSAEDFRKHYWPACRAIETDNSIGKMMFAVVKLVQKSRFARSAVLRMILGEQAKEGHLRPMSIVQWDMYTGSSSYREILMRTLHPRFWLRFTWDVLVSLLPANAHSQGETKHLKKGDTHG